MTLTITPIVHYEPYVPKFDTKNVTATGWLEENEDAARSMTSDSRFIESEHENKVETKG